MVSIKDRLKEILIRDNLIDADELESALKEQQKSGRELSKILVDRKLIDERVLMQILSESLSLPVINVSRVKITPGVLKIVPVELATKYKILPVSLMGDQLTLAVADPLNIFILDSIRSLTGFTISPIIAQPQDLEKAIAKNYADPEAQVQEKEDTNQELDSILKDIKDIKDIEDLELVKEVEHGADRNKVEQITDDAPIIRLTDTIIQQAAYAKASDVFIEPMEKTVRIRYRIDGVIREIDRLAKVLHFPIISRIKIISNLDISEHRLPQDGRFKIVLSGNKEVDFRVNVLPTAFGEKICLRVLSQEKGVLDIEQLGFEEKALKRLKECALHPHGMILTCGPTGSGKTTTLYSIMKHVDSPERNIITVEDPVEYQVPTLNQVNIKPQMGLTFSNSLRSILRQDPDIIMIGEIRDSETLDIAVKAALTGHLVLSSLHTTTAAGSVVRMVNMGIEPFLICSSVLAIVAQRLLRKICTYCKEEYELPAATAAQVGLKRLYPDLKKFNLYRGKGCKKCFKSGYSGRVGITEILIMTPEIREAILGRQGEFRIKDIARKDGMQTMREDGLAKVISGLTSLEEVLRVTAPDEAKEK